MDVQNTIGGSLQISTDVLVKIARLAALEVGGVAEVTTGNSAWPVGAHRPEQAGPCRDGGRRCNGHRTLERCLWSKNHAVVRKSTGKCQADDPEHDGDHRFPRQRYRCRSGTA